jgi:uncharacterized small protein (DUF1192 family)
MTNTKPKKSDVDRALEFAESIRVSEFGHSENEKKILALADEVIRLRAELKRRPK